LFNTARATSDCTDAKLAAATRKVDRRTLKTRAALLSAFRDLVLSHGYGAVAVGDIVRRANIGRSTFYLHFASKQTLLKHSLDVLCTRLAACVDGDVTPERVAPLLEHFRDQRHLNRVFFEDPIRSIWVRRLATLIGRKLRGYPAPSYASQVLPHSFVAAIIAEMQMALITHWLRTAASVSPERVATALLANTRALLPRERGQP
jgi:AcrR family transcriptional regulator